MVDVFSPEKRSEIMARVHSTGTAPEITLYGLLREVLGHRWRIDRNVHTLPGTPDLVVPTLRIALFADGCFYHRCPAHRSTPATNSEYWAAKFERNAARDRRNDRSLRAMGYRVWHVWEHDLRPLRRASTTRMLYARISRLLMLSRPT